MLNLYLGDELNSFQKTPQTGIITTLPLFVNLPVCQSAFFDTVAAVVISSIKLKKLNRNSIITGEIIVEEITELTPIATYCNVIEIAGKSQLYTMNILPAIENTALYFIEIATNYGVFKSDFFMLFLKEDNRLVDDEGDFLVDDEGDFLSY